MRLYKYFRFIAIIEFIAFAASIIWWIADTATAAYLTRGSSIGISILVLALLLLFGPSVGLLFLSASKYEEEKYIKTHAIRIKDEEKTNDKGSIDNDDFEFKVGDSVKVLTDIMSLDKKYKILSGSVGKIYRNSSFMVFATFKVNGKKVEAVDESNKFIKL